MLDRFNVSLVGQINAHLHHLDLVDSFVKFTGDGWLVMTSNANEVTGLCCLALIVANSFQRDMAQTTEIDSQRIPAARLQSALAVTS